MGSTDDQFSGQKALMNACPNCGEVIDVSSCAPYSKVMCPTCNTAIRVRAEFHHFSLQKQIGEGGMSRVFLAKDNTLNRQVALKILNQDFSKDAARTAQFEKEARITAAISHPNVVKVFSVGKDQDHFFIAMELVPNGSLDDLIARQRSVAEDRVLEIGEQMAKGLKAAFDEGLIHRDMKPGNMLFAEDGTAKIVDFGLALVFEHDVDESNEIWATPYYVPPEKLHKEPEDFRSDIYSLGASLFHALAGKPPYAADTSSLEELKAIKEKPVRLKEFAPSVSDETCELIDRMMARQPADRFSSYAELIDNIQYTRTLRAGGVAVVPKIQVPPKKKTSPLVGAVVVLLLLVGVFSLAHVFKGDGKESPGPGNGGDGGIDLSEGGVGFDGTGRTTAQKFVEARRRMLNGRVQPAAKAFQEIVEDSGTRQPTLNWARFNLGICALLEGRTKMARDVFATIRDSGRFSDADSDAPLAEFFVGVAERMIDPLPVLSSLAGDVSTENFEALALLAYGLKNWHFGEFNEAAVFFDAFEKSDPRSDSRWAGEYRSLVSGFLSDLRSLKRLPDIDRGASIEAYRDAVAKTETVLGELKDSGPVKERVATQLDRLRYSLKRMESEAKESEVLRMAALLDGEKQRFEELRLSLAPYRTGLQFSEAIAALKKETFEHPEIRAAYDDELYVWQSAEDFLNVLVADLNKNGYQGVIKGVSGNSAVAQITKAARDKLDFRVSAGELSMPLAAVSSAGLIEMAEAMPMQAEMKEYLRRQELLVMFAYLTGELQTAVRVGEELMVDSREFRQRWKQITARRQS